jgi:hypothetical protein
MERGGAEEGAAGAAVSALFASRLSWEKNVGAAAAVTPADKKEFTKRRRSIERSLSNYENPRPLSALDERSVAI